MAGVDHAATLDALEARFAVEPAAHVAAGILALLADLPETGPLRARALSDLGVIAHAAGDLQQAGRCFEAALGAQPGHPDALRNLADLVLGVGDAEQAIGLWRAATLAAPEDAEAWTGLARSAAARGEVPLALDAAGRALALDLTAADAAAIAGRLAAHPAAVRRPAPDRPGRLLVCVDHFHPSSGGSERLAEDAAVALRDLGWEVEVVTRALPDRTRRVHRGLPVHEVDPSQALAGLAAVVAHGRHDAILSFAAPLSWPITAPLGLPHPRPRVVVVPCINGEGDALLRARADSLRRYAGRLACADAVGHSSLRGLDARLCAELGHPEAYVPNAVHADAPDPEVLGRLGLTPGEPYVLVVGNQWPEKDHIGLLEHLDEHPGAPLKVVLVGHPSPDHPELAHRIAQRVAADPRVVLAGGASRAEVAGLMQAAALLALPSRVEATPLVILEAMSHGLPWLATPGCGAVHEHDGGVITPLSTFVPNMERLLADGGARRALGAAGHGHWSAAYSWGVVAPRYDALLRGAASLPPLQAHVAVAA